MKKKNLQNTKGKQQVSKLNLMCYHNNITTEKVCDSSYPALPEFNIAQFMGNTCKHGSNYLCP